MLEESADRVAFVHLQLDIPGCKNQFHYDRPLKKGTILQVDAGAYVQMYAVDYPRMATLGKATEAQKEVCKRVHDIGQTMADALKPGVRASDIHRVAVAAIEKAGVTAVHPKKLSGGDRFGHGQGMLITSRRVSTPAITRSWNLEWCSARNPRSEWAPSIVSGKTFTSSPMMVTNS